MTRPDRSSVRFTCPRCLAQLKASRRQAGTKRRCPRCHWVLEVPAKSRVARPSEGYALREGTDPSPAAVQSYIVVICPLCHTLMHAAEDQLGAEMVCPDCDTAVVVSRPAAVQEKKGPPPGPVEEYPFCEEVDGSTPWSWAADRKYLPVSCPVCRTLMQVTQDQVGQEIVCPDCRVPLVVPPAAEVKEKKSTPPVPIGEYALHEQVDSWSSAAGPAVQIGFPVRCPLCDTLLRATAGQVGQEMVCPDCTTSFVVPRPPGPKPKHKLSAEAAEEYGLGEAIKVPEYKPFVAPRPRRPRPSPPEHSFTLPRWTFFSGIFNFPLYRNSWPHWIGLSLGLITPPLVAGFVNFVLQALRLPGVLLMIVNMVLLGIVFLCGLMWLVVTSVSMLGILRDTAFGSDQVDSWPDALFLDWVGECFYVFSSLGLAAILGLASAQLLGNFTGETPWLLIPGCVWVMFPIALLSMLETDSPLNPVSLPVWRSLLSRWWAWGLFYLETTALVAGVSWLASLALPYLPPWAIVLAAPVLVAVLMIYFRLLGRLAWRCGQGAVQGRPRPVEPAPNDEEEDQR